MRPDFPPQKQADGWVTDSEAASEGKDSEMFKFMGRTNLANKVISQLGVAICFASLSVALAAQVSASLVLTPLGNHVGRIISFGSEKQMIGADAGRVIAAMANNLPSGYWAEMDFPRNPMGADFDAIRPAAIDPPVSKFVLLACPEPAGIALGDMLPETNMESCCIRHVMSPQLEADSYIRYTMRGPYSQA